MRSSPYATAGTVGLYEPAESVWPINSVWIDNTVSTQWLAVGFSDTVATTPRVPTVMAGSYTIRLNFDLGAYDPATVGFTIRAAADNSLAVSLNGFVLPNYGTPTGDTNYSSLASYLYTVNGTVPGSGLLAGANWLDFVVTNSPGADGNPAGLYVEFSAFTGTAVPEPSVCALLAGVAALGVVVWRRRRWAG
ncbi:MAG: PEP-CTERM sorting domain-containing protein [Opitutaceae bacterium]|nr:PEP-CTERM sorting domain-containing protein [Opitutaceae bacterium]